MASEKKVNNIKKDLRKVMSANNNEEAIDILKTLETLPVNLEILSKTKIGFTVNKLRKTSDVEEIKTRSKNLIKTWRKYLYDKREKIIKEDDVDENEEKKKKDKTEVKKKQKSEEIKESGKNEGKKKTEIKKKEKTEETKKKEKVVEKKKKDKKKTESDGTTKPEKSNKQQNSNDVRIKCKELLMSALKLDLNESIEMCDTPENLAEQLEEFIFKEFKDTNIRYKNRIRSRAANLKDSKNPKLKEKFLKGEISISQMAAMSSDDMASDQMKELRKENYFTEPFD